MRVASVVDCAEWSPSYDYTGSVVVFGKLLVIYVTVEYSHMKKREKKESEIVKISNEKENKTTTIYR